MGGGVGITVIFLHLIHLKINKYHLRFILLLKLQLKTVYLLCQVCQLISFLFNIILNLITLLEAKIGYFTDIGGGYFLSRLRNNIGYYLGLTGARIKG
jgi:hypothetical protein